MNLTLGHFLAVGAILFDELAAPAPWTAEITASA